MKASANRLTERGFDALRLHGPGTDLTIGLFPSSTWQAGEFVTVDGLHHLPNLPTEETFTTPDPERVDGYARATMPLELAGSVVSGIRVEFQNGRAVSIDADQGADALRAAASSDEGASRLGEIALVDGLGRIGALETTFFDTLIDENAASHIALGNGYKHPVEDEAEKERINASRVHIDFMIGSPELDVDGLTRDGEVGSRSPRRRLADLKTGVWLKPDPTRDGWGSGFSQTPCLTTRGRSPLRAAARGSRRSRRRDRRAAATRPGSRARRPARRAASSDSGRPHRPPCPPR